MSFDEFVAYYKSSTAQVFLPQQPMAENPDNAATTEALFKMMDANGDGKLTKDEVKAIEKLVATRDADEDECLSMTELIPNINNQRIRGQAQVIQPNGIPYPPNNTAVQDRRDLRAGPHSRHADAATHQAVRQGRRLRTDPRGVRFRRTDFRATGP